MERPAVNSNSVQFGLFEVDLQARELRKSGVKIKLNDQPFQVLTVLPDRAGLGGRPGTGTTRQRERRSCCLDASFEPAA